MTDGILSTAASGIRAAQTRLRVSAHNSANLDTRSFKKKVVTQASVAGGGVETRIRTVRTMGAPELEYTLGRIIDETDIELIQEAQDRIAELTEPGSRVREHLIGRVVEGSNVDLTEEAFNRIRAIAEGKSNAAVVRSRDEMLGTIVNIRVR